MLHVEDKFETSRTDLWEDKTDLHHQDEHFVMLSDNYQAGLHVYL